MTQMQLTVTRSTDRLEFAFPHGGTGIRLTRHDRHASVRLLFAGGRSSIDISFQPGAIAREVDLAARDHHVEPQRWRQQTLRALLDWWEESAPGSLGWCRREPHMLLHALGAVTHPLLGQAYERGLDALGEIPRWASPILRCTDPLSAARILEPSANRRTARALAESLVARGAPHEVELGTLAAAVVGAGMLSADELANVLSEPPPARLAPIVTTEQMREAREGIALYTPDRAADLLVDALRTADIPTLADTLQQLGWVRDRVPRPLPGRLRDLQMLCARHVPLLEGESAATIARREQQRERAEMGLPRGAPVVPGGLARADLLPDEVPAGPAGRTAPRGGSGPRWRVPQALLVVNGYRHAGLSYTVPTSAAELVHWGTLLSNCLGDYVTAAATNVAWLVGVLRDDVLIGCVEIEPRTRTVRQAVAENNDPFDERTLDTVLQALERCDVIR